MHANAALADMVAWLDQHLDVARFLPHEPEANGLVLDGGQPGVTKFAVAVNVTLTTIVGAAKAGAQLLVTHHASWPNIDLHLRDEKLEALRQVGVSLYCAHASLDCLQGDGNAWVLARALGVEPETPFCAMYGGQAGVVGTAAGEFMDFVRRASRELKVEVESHLHAKGFGRVAIVPGAGGVTSYMDEARKLGAETFVAGEGSMFTRIFAREAGMNLVLGTHYATEAPGIRALGERLSAQAQVPFDFIAESPDVF